MLTSSGLFSQSDTVRKQLGINTGIFFNYSFTENITIGGAYLDLYKRIGKHEYYGGLIYQSKPKGELTEGELKPRFGIIAGYKFYFYKFPHRENIFLHYTFQYLSFIGRYPKYSHGSYIGDYTQNDDFINNIIGLGFTVFFNKKQRFGFYYSFGYIISKHIAGGFNWSFINSNFGFNFKLTNLKTRKLK
jgi:hypothetical protein